MRETGCADCGCALPDDTPRQPCPDCGSTARKVSLTMTGGLSFSGHLTAVGFRADQAFAFSESERPEFTRYAHLEPDGTVLLDLKGLAPRNEQDSKIVCETLASAMTLGGVQAKLLGRGEADEDWVLSIDGERIGVQVVRALSDVSFWRNLARTGGVGPMRLGVSEATAALRAAIEHKTGIPPRQRGGLILVLDAFRVPAVSLGVVAEEFARTHGHWAEQLGLRAIYVVGPSTAFVRRLAG